MMMKNSVISGIRYKGLGKKTNTRRPIARVSCLKGSIISTPSSLPFSVRAMMEDANGESTVGLLLQMNGKTESVRR